jgi:hypothetical protein
MLTRRSLKVNAQIAIYIYGRFYETYRVALEGMMLKFSFLVSLCGTTTIPDFLQHFGRSPFQLKPSTKVF